MRIAMSHCPNLDCPTCYPPLPERFCNRCAAVLPFVDGNRFEQYEDALHLYLDGGYGERIDRLADQWHGHDCFTHAVLCARCVDELAAAEPWLRLMVAPTRQELGTHKCASQAVAPPGTSAPDE